MAEHAAEFFRRAKSGQRAKVAVTREYAEVFLGELFRLGINVARACLNNIQDPRLRRIVEGIFFSTCAGVAVGGTIGFAVGGIPGARVGAVIGGAVGLTVGVVAVTLYQQEGPSGPELVISASP